ncbi:MAG: primosomal protein N' [Candidatus Gracilibacteria bacterium]|nr:primosomal protein N' [Candidatus Gracilibacteria bacterium]
MKHIFTVDLSKDKSLKNQYLSNTLITNIEQSLKNNKKTILYLNKRGAYDLLVCKDCNYIKKCPKCDIILSVHKNPKVLMCHHCSYSENISLKCESCEGTNLKNIGVGTEQIEESVLKIFPGVKVFRLDSDNVSNISSKKDALENIKSSNIIIGTKMITTGFDFNDIATIGIILLEQELQIPKYDTEEKIYSNIKQLIGRGGRLGGETNIIIQTFVPNNEMIKNLIELNYKDFFKKTLEERKKFNYPPFVELATLRYKDKNKINSIKFITDLKTRLDVINNGDYEIIIFEKPIKRDNQYFSKIIIKGKNLREFLQNIKKEIFKNKDLVVIFE